MKTIKQILITVAVLSCSATASAHDFEVDGIYYNIISTEDKTVEVTYRGDSYDSYENEYIGEVVIPSSVIYNRNTYSVTSIEDEAFRDCSRLTSITIPEGVTRIGGNAFQSCSGLTSITIPEGVTRIGWYTFFRCDDLKKITIPEGVKIIGAYAFFECYVLKEITIPNSVTSIEHEAFYSCRSLTSITIPEGVTSIGEWAFSGCCNIKKIVCNAIIPPTAYYGSFTGINKECVLMVPEGTEALYKEAKIWKDFIKIEEIPMEDNIRYKATSDNTVEVISSTNKYSGKIVIPETVIYEGENYSVTSIGDSAFYDCSGLTSITIPEGVTSIGKSAFRDCDGLTSITIPNSVTSIGDCAFSFCSSLTSITIPNSVTSIGDWAFENCSGLISITIPKGVTSIGYAAFWGCSSLTSITIPNSVTSIGWYAFQSCSGLTSITIPNSVTSIGYRAFRDCSRLTSITIPNSVTSIGEAAFSFCSSLTSITIPESVTSIGDWAFENCSGLISITIPKGVTSIGYAAFWGCSSLTSITIPNSVTSIGWYAFQSCSSLTSITIPNSVTSIGDAAFSDCYGLTSITIPEGVTSIGYEAFLDCSGLTSITIPNSVTSIGSYAFNGCSSLESVYSQMKTPCAYPGDFGGSPVLYIPSGTRDLYIEQGWDDWASEIVEIETETDSMLEMPDTEVVKGGANVLVPVSMENEESITAFQLEVSLPDGVTMTGCELSARKTADHSVSFTTLPNGNYQVVCISLTSKPFSGTEGVLVNLQLSTDKEMAVGSYEMGICNIELSTTATEVLTQEDFTATLTVIDVEMGDTNGDGKISITDAVAIVNYILGNASASYVAEASDVNGDGKTSITDAVAIVNKILAGTNEAKSRAADMQLDPQ